MFIVTASESVSSDFQILMMLHAEILRFTLKEKYRLDPDFWDTLYKYNDHQDRVALDLESFPGILGLRWEYTLDEMAFFFFSNTLVFM